MFEIDQVIGWLSMDTDTFCNLEKHFLEEGFDIEEPFVVVNKLLHRHLPQHLKEKIDNIRDAIYLNKYDTSTNLYLAAEIEKWKNDVMQENSDNGKRYYQYIDSIKMLLPEGARVLAETSLHDARLNMISNLNDAAITFKLDCSQCCPPRGMCIMTFSGVKLFNISNKALPMWWLCKEIELVNENCFRLQVLFDNGECELVAENLLWEWDN
jgi:hypothetical protein